MINSSESFNPVHKSLWNWTNWTDLIIMLVNYGLKFILFLTQSYHMASEFLEYSTQVYCVLLI